jgi:hypothetical protein
MFKPNKIVTIACYATLAMLALIAITAFRMPAFQQKPIAKVIDMQDTFPVPKANPKQLFYLQRTANTNTIVYEINEDAKGQLVKDEPVLVYWLRYAEDGAKKELSYIQRVFAYGIKTEKVTDTSFEMHINSYKKKVLYLIRNKSNNKFRMLAIINARMAVLKRVFIRIDPGGSFWKPNVIYVEMKGIDISNGKETMERFKVVT